jgi:phage major head subunit gpT-like protein
MIINSANLAGLNKGFNVSFNKGLSSAPSYYRKVAMTTKSGTGEETYAWLGQLPKLREWLGDRVLKNLTAHGYAIKNKLFESTVKVPRVSIEDDQYGVYGPLFEELGLAAGEHPDELIFSLLAAGFSIPCYDGQYFFDTDHPVKNEDGTESSVSNFGGGSGAAWYLLDTTRAIKPLIFQERMPYNLQGLTGETDEGVFLRDEYLYGVRARANAGFGLWQLAYASKQTLDATNYAAARAAMMGLKGDEGRPLGIKPNVLVVSPALEQKALQLISNELIINSGVAVSNEWKGSADLIVTAWLS